MLFTLIGNKNQKKCSGLLSLSLSLSVNGPLAFVHIERKRMRKLFQCQYAIEIANSLHDGEIVFASHQCDLTTNVAIHQQNTDT